MDTVAGFWQTIVTAVVGYVVNYYVNEWNYATAGKRRSCSKRSNMCSIAYRTACWQMTFAYLECRSGCAGFTSSISDSILTSARAGKAVYCGGLHQSGAGASAKWDCVCKAAATGTGREHWRHGISAVLLGGQRVYGMDLRHDGNAVHAAQAGLELDAVREFLDYEEVFCMEEGKPLVREAGAAYTIELRDVTFGYKGPRRRRKNRSFHI